MNPRFSSLGFFKQEVLKVLPIQYLYAMSSDVQSTHSR